MTPNMRKMLDYLESYQKEHRYMPSFDEMLDALNLSSKSGAYRLLSGLEERGYITRLKNRARAIELVDRKTRLVICPYCQQVRDETQKTA